MKKEIVIKFPKFRIPEFMKHEGFYIPAICILVVYFFINLLTCCGGLAYGPEDRLNSFDCTKITRIEYIFPGKQLGCYLGEEV